MRLFIPVIALLSAAAGVLSDDALWPLATKPVITSTFGEFRLDHPHAGIDLRAVEGTPVLSPMDGYVWRIKTTSYGCGKALYIRGSGGNIYVFFHLAGFAPKIFERVFAEQLKTLRYLQDIFPDPGEIPVKRGELVGYVGRSGSYVDHLHYEVRGPDNCPINPLSVHKVADSVPPTILKVALVPLRKGSMADGRVAPSVKAVENGVVEFRAKGTLGIACEVRDGIPPSDRPLAPHRVVLKKDGAALFSVRLDRFCYEQRSIEFLLHHYGLLGSGKFLRLYSPGAARGRQVSLWERVGGVLSVDEDRELSVEACDFVGNCSRVRVVIEHDDEVSDTVCTKGTRGLVVAPEFIVACENGKRRWIGCNGSGTLKVGGRAIHYGCLSAGESISLGSWSVVADEGSLFGRQVVAVERVELDRSGFALKPVSDAVRLLPDELMPEGGLRLCSTSEEPFSSRAGIYSVGADGHLFRKRSDASADLKTLCARVKRSGTFAVFEDDRKPKVGDARITRGGWPEGWFVEFALSDVGSGIDDKRMSATFDGTPLVVEWMPFEKKARARLHFLTDSGPARGAHEVAIAVSDGAGNISTSEQTLRFRPIKR